ncbi:hypothetical protein F2Q69_00006380 [Brassica cretica]|uniref:Uncharacterized protein n=1 Tax=Brassica cretica TaxID=69181 RepID=A0A8S9PGY6_BRACR|nr:hypothetical protein F2Q69_00006380 [Brassica cretica]
MVILEPFECRVAQMCRCIAINGDLTTVRLSTYFDTRYSFELAFQCHRFEVNPHPIVEVMPVLLRSGQSASREKAVEEMKDCRSMTQHWCRSTVMPERRPNIFQDRLKPRSHTKYMPIRTRSSKYELLFFSDPAHLECSIRTEKRTVSIETNTSTSIDIYHRATINSSTRTLIDTSPREDMIATLVLQRDGRENCMTLTVIYVMQQDKDQRHLDEMEFKLEKLLKYQQEMTEDMNLHLDFLCKELNGRLETLDTRVKMLYTQASQTAEAVRKQEALIKANAVEVERHRVDDILDNGFGEVLEQEKLEEDAFLVESFMSVGSSYWCQPTPTTNHRPTPSDKHRSTPLLGSDKIIRIQSHSDFAARYPHPPTRARVKLKEVDRQQHERIDREQQERIDRQQHCCIDRQEQPSTDHPSTPYQVRLPDLDTHRLNATRNPSQTLVCLKTTEKISQKSAEAPEQEQSTLAETSLVEIDQRQWDGYKPSMEKQETKEGVQSEKRVKSRKVFIPKYLRREVNKVELDGFHKKVKRVPKDMSFEDAYYKYRLGNFFRESRETDKDIEMVFNKVRRKPKRTLKKEQDTGKFLIPCCIHDHTLPNALCNTGSAVSIIPLDTADLLGLKMEPS